MKKLFLLLLTVGVINIAGYAQSDDPFFTFGPKVGATRTTIKVADIQDGFVVKAGDPRIGFHAGLFTRFGHKFYVQPEVYFSSSYGKLEIEDATAKRVLDLKYKQIDIPVLVGGKFGNFFRINAGPMANILLKANAKGRIENGDPSDAYKKAAFGWQAGLGVDIANLTLDFRYQDIVGNFGTELDNVDFNQRNSQLLLSLGFKIL